MPNPTDRRTVLKAGVAASLSAGAISASPAPDRSRAARSKAEPFRAIAYNIHAFGPVAATEEGQAMARRPGARLFEYYAMELALYNPDAICIQEATSESNIAKLADLLGMDFRYYPGGHKRDDGSVHPMFNGAILTPHRIIESQDCPSQSAQANRKECFSRHLGRVVIDTGDQRWGHAGKVAVVSCHMLPAWENTNHIREAEIRAVGEAIAGDIRADRSVVVLGDMNHTPDMPEYAGWNATGLTDCFVHAGEGEGNTYPSISINERIDYAFAAGPMLARLKRCRTLAEGRFRAREGGAECAGDWALSDHMPVIAEFE